jgi:hypothetical protein
VTGFQITHAERAGWQRRAAGELATILDTHRDLPIIGWTVVPAGATLLGHVNGLAPAAEVRQAFHAWRVVLRLLEHGEVTSGATTRLRATADRNRVRVALSASVFDDGGAVTR